MPSSVFFDDGGTLKFSPSNVVKDTIAFHRREIQCHQRKHRGMQTFSQQYYHSWEEEYNKHGAEAIARYKADNCRFAPRC